MARKSKPARGLTARGPKGAPREKLAKAAGFRSDSEIAELFPENRQKLVRQLQQALADLVSALNLTEGNASSVASHYGRLLRALASQGEPSETHSTGPAASSNDSARSAKQAPLAAEAMEAPLALLPSLLADETLSDEQKIQRLAIYTAALEAVYEPLDLEPIGEPGEPTLFDPRHHDSSKPLSKGNQCTIRQIGFRRGNAVLRKAVVVEKE